MERALEETARRRQAQMAYNEANGIVPKTIIKDVGDVLEISGRVTFKDKTDKQLTRAEREMLIKQLTQEMKAAAKILEFEHAAYLRDRIEKLRRGK